METGPRGADDRANTSTTPLTERVGFPAFVLSAYALAIASYRAVEIIPFLFDKSTVVGQTSSHLVVAVEETTMRPGYPPWTMQYLATLIGLLGLFAAWSTHLSWAKTRFDTPVICVVIATAAGLVVLTVVHGTFLFRYDLAFGEGGLIPGILHVITLTRIDGHANSVGLNGYRVGQAIGLGATLVWPALLLSLLHAGDRSTR